MAFGQTVQRGVVREYNERSAKTPLAGVELRVSGAGSTMSGRDGSFALEFLTLEPGERVNVRRIEKEGYVLFNKEAVEQWNLNPSNPFVLVMCRADRFKRIRDNYYRNSEERYATQYKKERDELGRLQKEGKLKDEEYRKRLAEVSAEYERRLENLDTYVDRFARIDLSEISGVEQEIIELVEAGRFEEAIQKYDDLRIKEQLVEALERRRKVHNAIGRLTAAESNMSSSIDSLYASAERQIATLRLAGGVGNNSKILAIYREIAEADSSRVSWLQSTALAMSGYAADYNGALHYLRQALKIITGSSGEKSVDAANIYSEMGSMYRLAGDYRHAVEYLEKALAIYETADGSFESALATVYNNLGLTQNALGQDRKALDYLQRALTIIEAESGHDTPRVATVYNNIGLILHNLGEYSQALACHTEALEIRKRVLPPGSTELAGSYLNIGAEHSALGDYDEAIENFKAALVIMERELGNEHPNVALIYHDIGVVHYDTGDCPRALENYIKAMELWRKALGDEHPYVALSLSEIGKTYFRANDPEMALDYQMQALKLRKKIYGEAHPDIANSCVSLANIYSEAGDTDVAREYLEKALPIFEDFGVTNRVLEIANTLGEMFAKSDDYEQAIAYRIRALRAIEQKFGAVSEESALQCGTIGFHYLRLKRYPEALQYLSRTLEAFREIHGADSAQVKKLEELMARLDARDED